MTPDAVLATLGTYRETVLALQKMLVETIALGPENGGDGERAKADKIKAFMTGFGASEITEYPSPDPRVSCGHRPNLLTKIEGEDTSRTFWIIAHMDVVPVGDAALWHTKPFELVVEADGDTLRGRGVEDNHQGLVSALLLTKALHETGRKPPINLGLLFVADEETGNKHGLGFMTQSHPDLFGPDDLYLVPDSGLPDSSQIEIAEKSILWIKITVNGKQCHASTPDQGINSLMAAAAFIVKSNALHQQFDAKDPLFGKLGSTFTPSKIEANVENVNTISGRDVFYLDCRILPPYPLDDVITAIKAIGTEIEKQHGVTIDYDLVQRVQAPPATSMDSAIVMRLMKAIEEECGTIAQPEGIGGGTVAAYLRRLGLATAVWSTIYHNPHQPNERASIANTLRDAKIMARVLFG